MIANARRTLKSGAEYDHLFPKTKGDYIRRSPNANTDDTLELIQRVVQKTLDQTARLAPQLKGSTLRETCKNIWNFVYQHIQYEKDTPGHEEIRQPARTWADRRSGVDCDCYSVFISSILTNLAIPHALRVTDYGKGWQHIYVVVPKDGKPANLDQKRRSEYITIDDVTDEFDYEVSYTKKRDIPMTLNELNGLPVGDLEGKKARARAVVGQNSLAVRKTKVGKFLQKTGRAVMKVNPATALLRNGVLLAMRINFKGLASKLRFAYATPEVAAKYGYDAGKHARLKDLLIRLQNTFVKAGGEAANLKKAVLAGGNKKAVEQINGIGELGDPATLTAITAAMAALVPLIEALKGIAPSQPQAANAEYVDTPVQAGDYNDYVETTTDPLADKEGITGLGATKRAAKRVEKALKKQAAGKKLTARQQKILTTAQTVQAKAADNPPVLPVNITPVSVDISPASVAAATATPAVSTPAPSKKQQRKANRVQKREAVKSVRKAAKATGQSAKDRRAAVKSVKKDAKTARQAIRKGDTATASAIQQKNALVVKQAADQVRAKQAADAQAAQQVFIPQVVSDNTGINPAPVIVAAPAPTVRRIPAILNKTQNALKKATEITTAAQKVSTAIVSAKKTGTTADPEFTEFEDVTAQADVPAETAPKNNTMLYAGLGVGALLVGSMLFSGGNKKKKKGSSAMDGLPGKKSTGSRKRNARKRAYTNNRSRSYEGVPLS